MILVLNSGSSSVKAAWFMADTTLKQVASAAVDNVGSLQARLSVKYAGGELVRAESLECLDFESAIDLLLTHVETWETAEAVTAVGHRIVHGGSDFNHPCLIDDALLNRLEVLTALAPMHLPQNLAGIAEVTYRWPRIPQVACFDTAFHRTLPAVARMTGLPRTLLNAGIRRYGFHGLSCESILKNLIEHEGKSAAGGRIVVAHLGSGASMTALKDGMSLENTMGFSTLGGLLMGTRCGDIDPGVLLYLLNENFVDVAGAQRLMYEQSGLIGVSGISSDMHSLLGQQNLAEAREAVDLFCYSARKHLAALTAALGGIDRLVFTGGIGENSPEIRQRICADLAYLGIDVDPARNQRQERAVSLPNGAVVVNVIPSEEEFIIASHTHELTAGVSPATLQSSFEPGDRT